MIRVDFHYIKNKLLKQTFREWRETLEVLTGEDNVITDEVQATINKCISKQIKKDVKDINRTFKLINRRRKRLDKNGYICDEYEFDAYINELGINTGNYFNSDEDGQNNTATEPEEESNAGETNEETAQDGAEELEENPGEEDEPEQTG